MESLRRRGRARVVEVIYLYLFCVDVVEVVDDRRALEELGARVRVPEERDLEAALFFYHSVAVRAAAPSWALRSQRWSPSGPPPQRIASPSLDMVYLLGQQIEGGLECP